MEKQKSDTMEKQKPVKKWLKLRIICGSIIGFCALIMILIVVLPDGETVPAPAPYQYEQETPKTPEKVIEEKFIQILGDKTNMGDKRVIQIEVFTYDIVNNYQNVDIEYMADENLTTGLTRFGMWMDAQEVLEDLPLVLSSQVMKITLNPHLELVDRYGNELIGRVMTIRVTRETWEKINWGNFITDNIPKIAETYWEHPTLSR